MPHLGRKRFCCLFDESSQCRFVSASPLLAVPPTKRSSHRCGGKGPSDMYSSMHPEVWRVASSATLASGRVLALEEEGGRKVMIFSFFSFVELVQGFHRCIKICTSYLHSLGLVTETNK